MTDPASLDLLRDGAVYLPSVLSDVDLAAILSAIEHLPSDRAGIRLYRSTGLQHVLSASGKIGAIAASWLGEQTRPVRAILFDKSAVNNWALAWHQDRTIAVQRREEVSGYGPWTIKDGVQHVAPPADLLAHMITLRVHLDAVPEGNAPLLIALGSHCLGRIPEEAIGGTVRRSDVLPCYAKAGDVWAYSTPILHASEAAMRPARRRVLQVDYAARELPGGLRWHGIDGGCLTKA